jgi:hypothetical protein
MRQTLIVATFLSIVLIAPPASAKVVYVDNRIGDDVNDGTTATLSGIRSGPVRSLRRAALLLGPGDVLEIANTGDPYYGTLRLIGRRCSGVPSQPLVVNGNGATIDGTDAVPSDAWVSLGGDLWRLEPPRKGWFQLVRGDSVVPEVRANDDAPTPTPPAGRWAAWRGAIYYRGLPDEIPGNGPYRVASREAGVFLYGVRNVVVRDLRLRYHHLDGISAHDQAYDVELLNLMSESNARSGIFVGGSSDITVRGGGARRNREASLLLRERGKADVRDVALDAEPVVAE